MLELETVDTTGFVSFLKFVFLLPLVALGCHRAPAGRPVDSLNGLTLSVSSDFHAQGTVDDAPAVIVFDPAQSVSFITSKCLSRPTYFARVSVPDPFGHEEAFPLTHVASLQLGATHFRTFDAAVAKGATCTVTLGAPELKGVALEFRSTAVILRASQSREAWLAETPTSLVLPLTVDPRFDWPLLTVRIRQGAAQLDAALLVSLREPQSRVFEELANSAGLRRTEDIAQTLAPEKQAELAALKGYPWDTLQFAPGIGLNEGVIQREEGAPTHALQGLVGVDVWKRLSLTYDVGSALLVIHPQSDRPATTNTAIRRVLQWLSDSEPKSPAKEAEPIDPD